MVEGVLAPMGLAIVKKRDLDNYAKVLEILSTPDTKKTSNGVECIVFSMDRALQLHAFLSSYFEKVTNPAPMNLLYRTSNAAHQKAYEEVIELFSSRLACVTKESAFRQNLIELLDSLEVGKVIFFVDDDLFIDSLNMLDYTKYPTKSFIPSLRLAPHLQKCYTYQKDQPVPLQAEGIISEPDKFCWQWKSGTYDWAIPFSVDGNAFSWKEITLLAKTIPFSAPNSFESNLLQFTKMFNFRYGVCYRRSKIVNIPCNMVQTESRNLHGALHQDLMLEKWNDGLQMDYRRFYGLMNMSAHQDLQVEFTRRSV